MFKVLSNDLGDVYVEPEVVETITGMATVDCYGLVGMVPKNFTSGIVSVLGVDSLRKGVKVQQSEEGSIIDVYVIMAYGTKIHEIAHNVMDKVVYVLTTEAGLRVAKVNVNVMGIKYVP
ncbi:MAG: Asp23/Gls24 family envelope stress response protein [Syntrophomonadaceae bacterium]|nr:Asp23/Gls24 family envelope stress response protein [Syntrophomonadaceae bacterium]